MMQISDLCYLAVLVAVAVTAAILCVVVRAAADSMSEGPYFTLIGSATAAALLVLYQFS